PVAQSIYREPQYRPAVEHVFPCLAARAQDHLLPALAPGDQDRQGHGDRDRRGGRRVLARKPRKLRGLPMIAQGSGPIVAKPNSALGSAVARPARLLDPGLCLTLRPMAYPEFFAMFRAAIKNT